MGELENINGNKDEQIARIYEKIEQIKEEAKRRSEDALKDPTYSTDSKKLTLLMDMNMQDLAEMARLHQEIVILRMEQYFEANN